MAKILTTTITIAYLLITAAAAVYPAALPPIKAHSSEAGPAPLSGPASMTMAADSPGPDCLTSLANLADCLDFVENGSTVTKPEPACCPEVDNLVKTQPICLCELLANSTQFDLSIDTNRALKLPSLCKLTAPPVSMCAAIGVPVAVATPRPSAAKPPPGNEDNASLTILLPSNQHFLIGLALVLYTSIL